MNKFLALFLVCILGLSLKACVTPSPFAPSVGAEQDGPWPPLLKTLNQDPENEKIGFEQQIGTDLLSLYREELKSIAQLWKAQPDASKSMKLPETKRAMNEFFHQEIKLRNAQTFTHIENKSSEANRNRNFRSLGEKILAKVRENPVAKLEAMQSYDPTGQLGFCFGRALLVHYYLREAGVSQEDIAKIFSAGELRVGHKIWNFHVAVMVRDSEYGFLVIDPIHEKPMPLDDWRALTADFDIKGKLSRARFYVTDPRKFLPSFGAYDIAQLENEHLKSYFTDLALSLKR